MSDKNFSQFPAESGAMSLLRRLGLHSLAWSLRRLHVPVPDSALVLEVGSGGNPYFRAKVQATVLDAIRRLFSQRKRNRILDVVSLLRCPECQEGGLSMEGGRLRCGKCEASYEVVNDIPRLFPSTKGGIDES